MNTNVGDMPLDIFSDYISDIIGEEWSWEYLVCIYGFGTTEVKHYGREFGNGYCYWYGSQNCFGSGILNGGIIPRADSGWGVMFGYHLYSGAFGEGKDKFKEDDYD